MTGGIEEATYESFRGHLGRKVDRNNPIHILLKVNGAIVDQAEMRGSNYELSAGRVILPSDHVEILAFDYAGRQIKSFEWGQIDRPLPPAWSAGRHYKFPSVFVLGAAKSGTTSLHVYLDQHPDIFMSKPKEPFFFEAEYARGATFYYNKYFGGWRGEKIVGESRHRNLYLPYIPSRLSDYNPEAKLIVVLRNPAERAVSHWWHWRSRGLEPLSPAAAFQNDLERILEGKTVASPQEIERYVATFGPDAQGEYRTYLDSGYYSEQLDRYLQHFRRERLHIVFFEDLVRNPGGAMRDIFRFLELDDQPVSGIDLRPRNQSAAGMWDQVDEKIWCWLIEHYKPHNRRLEQLLSRSFRDWDTAPRPRT